jgi:hypothetical protein
MPHSGRNSVETEGKDEIMLGILQTISHFGCLIGYLGLTHMVKYISVTKEVTQFVCHL